MILLVSKYIILLTWLCISYGTTINKTISSTVGLLQETQQQLTNHSHVPIINIDTFTTTASKTNKTPTITSTNHPPSGTACNSTIISNEPCISNTSCHSPESPHSCYQDPIFCEQYFLSGRRELNNDRPRYGEYSYLNHENWVRVIPHGGVAFLFNPCISSEEKDKLRDVASTCLHRYVIAPYQKLSRELPIAMVSWGCYYMTSRVNITAMKLWIQSNAYKGPASHVKTQGTYDDNLMKKSTILTNEQDLILCPTKEEKKKFINSQVTTPPVRKKVDPEDIIMHRLYEAKHKRDKPDITITANITLTKVRTGSAVWAAGSLIFLCSILLAFMFYTKMWSHQPRGYKYEKLDHEDGFEYEPGHSQFSLLKSSQKFMSIFRTEDKREHKLDSMSRVNLMVPINEDEEEEETVFRK